MPRRKRDNQDEAAEREKKRADRVNQGAYRNFNNNNTKQPSAKVNVGDKIDIEYNADGTQIARIMSGTNVEERIAFMKQVRTQLQGKYPGPLGEELRLMRESIYVTNIPTPAILNQPPPLGIGIRPADLLDVDAQADYSDDKKIFKRNFAMLHNKYVEDCAAAKIDIMEERITADIKLSLDQDPAFIAAKAKHVSMVKFLQELEKAVVNILKVDDQISVVDSDIEGLENAIAKLTVKMEGDSLRYCTKIREYLKQLKALKVQNEVEELPAILNNATRANRITDITRRVEKEIDGNNRMMFNIYQELMKFGIDADSHDSLTRLAKDSRTQKDHAPFPRLVSPAGVITGELVICSQNSRKLLDLLRKIFHIEMYTMLTENSSQSR